MRLMANVAVLVTLAPPLWAEGEGVADPAVVAALITAVTANGCQMTEDEADPLLDPLGYPQDAIRAAADALVTSGQATFVDDTFVLGSDLCGGGTDSVEAPVMADETPTEADGEVDAMDPRAQFLSALRDNDCRMFEDDADTMLPAYGLTMDMTSAIAEELITSNEAIFSDGEFILAPSVCAGVNGG